MPTAKPHKVMLDTLVTSPTTKTSKQPPYTGIKFNDGRDNKAGMEDIKVATANITVNEVISSEHN
jgi:hypothetical protein